MPVQSVLSRLRQSVVKKWPVDKWKSAKTIVAVSGGPDSVALLRVMSSLFAEFAPDNRLVVVHVDHAVRPESKTDAAFVESLAANMNCEFHGFELNSDQAHDELSLRDSRYQILKDSAAKIGARYIATGHTKDDQVETILFRIIRGTGLDGLTGVPFARALNEDVAVIRPLLDFNRSEVIELLTELNQDYRTDSSNLQSEYSRNYIRNDIIPKIKERFGTTFPQSVLKLGQLAVDNQNLLSELATDLFPFIESNDDAIEIQCEQLNKFPPGLARHAIRLKWAETNWPQRDMTMAHWNQICDAVFASRPIRPTTLPGNIRLQKDGNIVLLAQNRNTVQ